MLNLVLFLYGKWFTMVLILLLDFYNLFHWGINKSKWKVFTPGSILASLGIIFTSAGFNYYISHFFTIQQNLWFYRNSHDYSSLDVF